MFSYCNVNVLNDNILRGSVEAESFTKQNTFVALSNNAFVAVNRHTDVTSFIICYIDRRLVGIASTCLDCVLTSIGSCTTRRESATFLLDCAFGTSKIVGLVDHDHAWCTIC